MKTGMRLNEAVRVMQNGKPLNLFVYLKGALLPFKG